MVLITAESIFQLILLIICGYIIFRFKMAKHESLSTLNTILMHLALPALLLESFQSDVLFNGKDMLLPTLGISALIQASNLVFAFLLIRKHPYAHIERASVAFTNNAFVAIPLLSSIFGDIGTFYAGAFNAIASLVFYSVLPAMITGSISMKECLIKTFNDKTIVCIFAIILLALDIHIPDILMTPVGWLGSMTTPLAMIIIGSIIAESDLLHMFTPRIVWISFLRLIAVPLMTAVILYFITDSEIMFLSFCILASTPTASLVTIYTEQANGNVRLATGLFLFTTILTSVTIPLIVLIVSQFT